MRRIRLLGALGAALLASMSLAGCNVPAWGPVLLTKNAAGTASANGTSYFWTVSPDGTKVLFTSLATDLGPTDTNAVGDLYVRDIASGTTTLITAPAPGSSGSPGAASTGVFSPDGTKVAFNTRASNLGPTDTNNKNDVYLHDLATGENTLVSHNATGTDSGSFYDAAGPTFSPDGTKLGWSSSAPDIVPEDASTYADLFLYDIASDTNSLVSVSLAGTGGHGHSGGPIFSPDGDKVAFSSEADDLTPGVSADTHLHIYIRDLTAGTTTLVSTKADGAPTSGAYSYPVAFSPDGTQLLLTSNGGDLVPEDTNSLTDLYLRDLTTGDLQVLSVDDTGIAKGIDATSSTPQFGPDGDTVLYTSYDARVYLRDLTTGIRTLVSVNGSGAPADGRAMYPVLSPDGNRVAFVTASTNLAADHPARCYNGTTYVQCLDVYVRDLAAGTTTLISRDAAGHGGNNNSDRAAWVDDQRLSLRSQASDLVGSDTNGTWDLFIATDHEIPGD